MSRAVFYPFFPDRILWTGALVLGGGLALGILVWILCLESPAQFFPTSGKKKELGSIEKRVSFSFPLKKIPLAFSLPRIEPEMTFSFDPPRPDCAKKSADLFVRFKQSTQSKRITLPCRIGLQFSGGKLGFGELESPFWLELRGASDGEVQAIVWIEAPSKEKIEAERFKVSPHSNPLQGAMEFAEGSPFRLLGEARWLGHDVFSEKYVGLQTFRIAFGPLPNPQILDIRDKDWIVWDGTGWVKGSGDEKAGILARIESADSKTLILEGWDGEAHVRLSLNSVSLSPFKMRGEEIFNSIRVRSEKQISCMMEKQCLILRAGDWVMKSNGRWKILRKKEEKEAYQSNKISGEMFVFEKIEGKLGQKFITGFLFNPEKNQVIPIDLAANKSSTKKEGKEK